jgi:hypothetical protein
MPKPCHRPSRRSPRRFRATLGLATVWLLAVVFSPMGWAARSAAGDPSAEELAAAADELDAARQRADQARAAAEKAKRELDRYVARHFEEQENRAEEPVFVPELPKQKPAPETLPPPAIEAEWLLGQIHKLKLERASLLSRYTPAHPQVVEMDVRLADLRQQLADARQERPAEDDESGDDDAESKVKREWTERLGADKDRDRQSVSQYRKALARLQKAQRQAQAAAEAEARIAQKLEEAEADRKAALAVKHPPLEPPVVAAPEPVDDRPVAGVDRPPIEVPVDPPRGPDPTPVRSPEVPWPTPLVETPRPAPPQVDYGPRIETPIRVTPSADSSARPGPEFSGRNDMNREDITVTNTDPDRSPATYYPAEKPGALAPEAPRATVRSPLKRPASSSSVADPSVTLAETDPETLGERLIAPRREPVAAETPTWPADSIVDNELVDETRLDEPFLMEREVPNPWTDETFVDSERQDDDRGIAAGDEGASAAPGRTSSGQGGGASPTPQYEPGRGVDRDPPADWHATIGRGTATRDASVDVDAVLSVDASKPLMASQPIALAAIVAAVLLAIVASIWLARANAEGVFPTAEAVKASLDLPLVGVVPAAHGKPRRPTGRLQRGIVLLGQIMVAVAVFGAVAYAIGSPGVVEHFCSESIATLDRAWSTVRTR